VLLGANEPDEVIDRFLEDGLREIGATDGVVLEVDPLAQVLTPLGDRSITDWDDRTVALDAPGPLAEAVRTRQSVLLENLAQVKAYVGDAASSLTNEQAWAAVPLVAYGQTLGVAGIRFDGARQFDADDRAFLERVGRRLAEALDRSRLYAHQRDAREQAEAAARWLRSVQSMAAALARSATRREVARALREHLHPATRADFSLVAALSSDGRSLDVLTGTSTFAMPTEQLGASVERAVRDSILRGRSIELDSAADVRAVFPGLVDSDIESFALLPIRAGRAVTGVIGMGWAKPGGISPESRRLLAIAVSLGGAAFERATAYDVEHHIADTLQRQLLTEPEAELAGVAWAARYSPGSSELTAGGDWYDVIGLPGDRLSLIVGDIVGHGVVAAAAMGQLRSATRALAVREDPVGVLEALDSYVTTTRQGHLSSIAYVVLDPAQGVAEYAIAGHPPPLVRTPDGTVVFIEDTRGPLLGLAKPGTRTSVRHRIEPGSTIVLYTDGLVERRGEALDAGLARLGYLVAESPLAMHPEGLCDGLLQRLAEGGTAPDDITLLAVEFEPLGKQLRHTFPARLEMLRVIRGEVRAWLGANGLEPSDVTDIVLACDEACANAIEHGSHGQATDTIDLVLRADGDELVVSVTDSGAWPDDDRIARRAHGLQIMEALMDHVEIVSDDGGTTVTMLFRRRRASLD
jgi:serine/threonine-protein kinase RsbW